MIETETAPRHGEVRNVLAPPRHQVFEAVVDRLKDLGIPASLDPDYQPSPYGPPVPAIVLPIGSIALAGAFIVLEAQYMANQLGVLHGTTDPVSFVPQHINTRGLRVILY